MNRWYLVSLILFAASAFLGKDYILGCCMLLTVICVIANGDIR